MQKTPSPDQIAFARTVAERAIAKAEAVRAAERGHRRPGRHDRIEHAIEGLTAAGRPLAKISGMAKPHSLPEKRAAAPIRELSRKLNVERDKLRRML